MVIGILSITPGCVTQSSADNPDSRIIAVNRTELPTPEVINSTTIIPTVCPSSANQSYWIKINPIGNVTIGELILVDGTTNIPVGTTLTSDIYYESFTPGIVSPTRSIRGFAEVRETDNCINNFTFQANS